jgi:UDP-apiose/xylose synthase
MSFLKKDSVITILGAGGFIGSHLVEALTQNGYGEIIAIDVSLKKLSHLSKNENVKLVSLDIRDIKRLKPYIRRSDCVILLAALCNPSLYNTVPLEVIDANYARPRQVIEMCSELEKRVIYFSTSEVYGTTVAAIAGMNYGNEPSAKKLWVLNEEMSPMVLGPVSAQRWCYASAKQLMERTIYAYGFQRGLEYSIVRPFNFIGPRMDFIPGIDGEGVPRVLACFLDALMSGKPLKLVDGGLSRRCFTYIEDAIDAVLRILECRPESKGKIFNIGNPANEVSIKELADKMVKVYCDLCAGISVSDIVIENVSSQEFYGPGYEDSDRRMPCISNATTLLEWEPHTNLDTALELSISSYIKEYGNACRHREAC